MSKGKIFITGASGYIGSVVTEQAISKGYTVHGLSRNEAADEKLKAIGAIPIRGDLSTLDVLRREASQADVVLHLAFIHDWKKDFAEIVRIDGEAVDAIGEGLKGTSKPFVISSGSALVDPDPAGGETTEESPPTTRKPFVLRVKSENRELDWAKEGVGIISVRLPPYVYGRGGSGFIPWLMQMAAKNGEALFVDEGNMRTSGVHVDDAAALYLLVAEKLRAGDIEAGEIFNGTASTYPTVKEMAEAIGAVLGVPVRSAKREEVEEKWGAFLVGFVQYTNMASNKKARQQLGWQPRGVEMLADIRSGSYVELAKKSKEGETPKSV